MCLVGVQRWSLLCWGRIDFLAGGVVFCPFDRSVPCTPGCRLYGRCHYTCSD